ncbi:dihydrodipicolinate synthase family protein [Bythopirellula goksoeyrii]|uniref:N-acetylneuraminate lyase n=1 Tax=Bythopirellula goksoeyrii TaxID=1400387 RepID=A0A5B9QK16_9BACT|nr:dihydrodipicolinate synthase family protein [Bythopirellula goksoeyrii]QEG37386.1 N-acetylneuraminate lyase [Bythopirellula goksoeyrii]
MPLRLTGLIAATCTPMRPGHAIDLDAICPLTDQLVADGVEGLYVCGSTGEGVSMTTDERKRVAEAFLAAAGGRVPVIVHVGHNSLADARDLAQHAQRAGATFTSAVAPNYFPIASVEVLVDAMATVAAAAPELPFYYYHIPAMTGVDLDMIEFLRQAGDRIDNFAGIKYTANSLDEYQQCVALDDGRFDVLYGYDELLLPSLAVGARGAVGCTYNIAAPLYRRIIEAFDAGDLARARADQLRAVQMIRTLSRFPFLPAVKAVLAVIGAPCGTCRAPQPQLRDAEVQELCAELEAIGFFDWARRTTDALLR